MKGASSFLVDTNDYKILAHRDVSLIGTKLSTSSGDALMKGAAEAVMAGDLGSREIDGNMVAFASVAGTDWVLVSYIPEGIVLKSVEQMGILLFVVGAVAIALITVLILLVVRRVIAPLTHITNNISAMSEGDFTIEVDSSGNDEIGIIWVSWA